MIRRAGYATPYNEGSTQQEVRVRMAISDYESPSVVDLGAFEDLTQKGTGQAKDTSEGSGTKV